MFSLHPVRKAVKQKPLFHSCPKADHVVKIVIASCSSDISALDSYHRNRCSIKHIYKCCYFMPSMFPLSKKKQ